MLSSEEGDTPWSTGTTTRTRQPAEAKQGSSSTMRSEARLALLVLLWLVSAAIERRLRRPVFEGGAKRFND